VEANCTISSCSWNYIKEVKYWSKNSLECHLKIAALRGSEMHR
jgi:hypothetical protein